MKPRHLLTANEVAELQATLDRKLDRIGIESQPEVALRLLGLINRGDAPISEYAEVIRIDHSICGRVLKLANSAIFGQRKPVTTLDRACVVLGLERIRSLSLGLYLSRAAVGGKAENLTREVWGESVFRACLAAQMAAHKAPSNVSEAFVIGLMLDAGIPLMWRLLGDGYTAVYRECRTPGALVRREGERLGFTHVDVIAALCRRWRLPELLRRPIEWHHTKPADALQDDPVHRLHHVSYIVGLLRLGAVPGETPEMHLQSPGVGTAQRLLGAADDQMEGIVQRAVREYSATIDLFSDVASGIANVDAIFSRVQDSLIEALDNSIEESMRAEMRAMPKRLVIGGQSIELTRDQDGAPVAYLYDSSGQRLLSHRFREAASSRALCDAFGLDLSSAEDSERVESFIRSQAA